MFLEEKKEFYTEGEQPKNGTEAENNPYEKYKALGGIINEADYTNALEQAEQNVSVGEMTLLHARSLMRRAGIDVEGDISKNPIVLLYGVLRSDKNLSGAEYHHSDMSDQNLFAEALRMLGESDALEKFMRAPQEFLDKNKQVSL
ncbi:MAG: hypothetical protein HYT94_00190 [Parcubacteria group bacterium]|nr:hypothetical protein [Parcubacteria group bacterium]